MGCCGNKRGAQVREQTRQTPGTPANPGQAQRYQTPDDVYFQYTGDTALSIRGMLSRRLYRFPYPQAVVAVDGRDAPGFKAVPLLKTVKQETEGFNVLND